MHRKTCTLKHYTFDQSTGKNDLIFLENGALLSLTSLGGVASSSLALAPLTSTSLAASTAAVLLVLGSTTSVGFDGSEAGAACPSVLADSSVVCCVCDAPSDPWYPGDVAAASGDLFAAMVADDMATARLAELDASCPQVVPSGWVGKLKVAGRVLCVRMCVCV